MLFIFTSVNLDELTEKSNRDLFLQQFQIPFPGNERMFVHKYRILMYGTAQITRLIDAVSAFKESKCQFRHFAQVASPLRADSSLSRGFSEQFA